MRERKVDSHSVGDHLDLIETEAANALEEAESEDDMARAKALKETVKKTQETRLRLQMISPDDTTDAKYQVEDEKRRLAHEIAKLTSDSHLKAARSDYQDAYNNCHNLVESVGNDADRQLFQGCQSAHSAVENSMDEARIRSATDRLMHIYWDIKSRDINFLSGWFEHIVSKSQSLNDPSTAQRLITQGREAISAGRADTLRATCAALMSLLPNREQAIVKGTVGFN